MVALPELLEKLVPLIQHSSQDTREAASLAAIGLGRKAAQNGAIRQGVLNFLLEPGTNVARIVRWIGRRPAKFGFWQELSVSPDFKPFLARLLAMLNQPGTRDREAAAWLVSIQGPFANRQQIVESLADCLQDSSSSVVKASLTALKALGSLGTSQELVLKRLVALMRDP